ncbi:MAG TPA: polyphosphate kinase 1 [Bryobacteraceae bacterium]|nr:polyphosphate kinase 1 [Bryobacteraceae bacterium]
MATKGAVIGINESKLRTRVKKATQRAEAPKATPIESTDLSDPSLYINRELGMLAFQRRVLEEAQDPNNPLLERVKFLAILGSNLDEFFMVRVAGLVAQVDAGSLEVGPDGMTPKAQLMAIRREVKKLLSDAHKCLREQIIPELEENGIQILSWSDLTPKQRTKMCAFFKEVVFPVLTPLAFDPGRPFPHISNLSLNLAAVIRDGAGAEHFARLKVPDSLAPLVPLNGNSSKKKPGRSQRKRVSLVWLEDIIAANLKELFPGMHVVESHPFHVTRDAEVAIKELEAEDLLETIEEGVRQRRFGDVVRLVVSETMPSQMLKILLSNLEVNYNAVYRVKGPLSLKRLMALHEIERPDLKDIPFVPALPDALKPSSDIDDIFGAIRRSDIVLHHPFDSFQPVIDFLRTAAQDPNVLAIKMVLYRVGKNAPVVEALLSAMEQGKQVAVLVELKARFDEESNIEWARALEREGVHVVYGLVGLKIHCKVAMVVRREGEAIRRYVHLATGNYNAVTAHLYTDLGMFTCDNQIADDVTNLFNYLTGYSAKNNYQKLLVAPVNLRKKMHALIEREVEHQNRGNRGHIVFKMNALVDGGLIKALYRASQAGVKIELLVRGICCLRPGIRGVSDNIEVTSIVGRFLEHSRIYYFRNGGENEIYVGSADLMPRNLNRRVEVLFPLRDAAAIKRVKQEILATYQADSVKKRRMRSDGSYVRLRSGNEKAGLNSQAVLLERARASMPS